MKKNWLIAIVLMLTLVLVCAACGSGSGDEADNELPTVTAPPAVDGEESIIGAEANDRPDPSNAVDYAAWLETLSEEQRYVEEHLLGAKVEELIEYLGKPKKVSFSTSCLVANAEDGLYEYDGFSVQTTRFANGTEYVMGTIKH